MHTGQGPPHGNHRAFTPYHQICHPAHPRVESASADYFCALLGCLSHTSKRDNAANDHRGHSHPRSRRCYTRHWRRPTRQTRPPTNIRSMIGRHGIWYNSPPSVLRQGRKPAATSCHTLTRRAVHAVNAHPPPSVGEPGAASVCKRSRTRGGCEQPLRRPHSTPTAAVAPAAAQHWDTVIMSWNTAWTRATLSARPPASAISSSCGKS